MEPPPPPPQSDSPDLPSKEALTKRYKLIWRVLLISNLALGAYMFAKARKKNLSAYDGKTARTGMEHGKVSVEAPVPATTTPVPEEPPLEELLEHPPVAEPVKVYDPIPEDQQRELFSWLLEEKRKLKPREREEKRRIDEEKAILKQFIRAKSLPRI